MIKKINLLIVYLMLLFAVSFVSCSQFDVTYTPDTNSENTENSTPSSKVTSTTVSDTKVETTIPTSTPKDETTEPAFTENNSVVPFKALYSEKAAEDAPETANKDYTFEFKDGNWYLVFNDPSLYYDKYYITDPDWCLLPSTPVIYAYNVEDLTYRFRNGYLTEYEKIEISACHKNNYGVVIFDINNMWTPSLDGVYESSAYWKGTDNVTSTFRSKDGLFDYGKMCKYTMDDSNGYLNRINYYGDDCFKESIDGKDIIYYEALNVECKAECYTIQDGDRSIGIIKEYRIGESTVNPKSIHAFYFDGNNSFSIDIYNPFKPISDDFLASFGINPI